MPLVGFFHSMDYRNMPVFLPLGDRNKDGPSRMQ